MADYTVDIGGSSTMMIRDTGSDVEFWFRTGDQTWNNEQPWSYYANGSSSGTREFRLLRGGNWQKFGEVRVTYDQNVSFTIYNTGLGFPTYTFTHAINRSSVPPAPLMKSATAVSSSSIRVVFSGTGTGGSPILQWQIGYGTNSSGPSSTVTSDGDTVVGGFSSGQRVFFWARGRNALGWSAWSARREATTWRVPSAPNPVTFSQLTQVSVRTQFTDGSNGGTAIVERQLGYGLSSSGPTDYAGNLNGVNTLTGLDPGKTYYFWARNRNSVGWGPWSARSQVNLIAGARVKVGTTWKRAVPYVRVNGVWKVARPWVRNAGVWKGTST
jgi:hypothetical protein